MCLYLICCFSQFIHTLLHSLSDRVVDDLNPVLTFTRREVESLLHFVEEEPEPSQVQLQAQDGLETVLGKALHFYPHLITKVGFRIKNDHCAHPSGR